uniref:Uncharacterized protein n=1 Tax=Arion vulgaris TaxID=1028688 RepID=A0A0B7BCJ7_9EUPU
MHLWTCRKCNEDILNILIEQYCKEDFHLNQSMSTAKLKELRLKIGVARKNRTTGM